VGKQVEDGGGGALMSAFYSRSCGMCTTVSKWHTSVYAFNTFLHVLRAPLLFLFISFSCSARQGEYDALFGYLRAFCKVLCKSNLTFNVDLHSCSSCKWRKLQMMLK